MGTTTLGSLPISRLGLGTLLMGDTTAPEEAHRMLDGFRAAGGTLIDTANTYSDGAAEPILAPWLARHRDEVVLAAKVRFPVSDLGGEGLSAERVRDACDASLRRLGVETIDLCPRTLEQLEGLLGAVGLRLSRGDRARLEAHAQPPEAPQRMLAEQAGTPDLRGALRRRPAVVAR